MRPSVAIVSPALADANNGNWRTADRWRRFLAPIARVRTISSWPDAEAGEDQALIALHARRSAASIQAWYPHHGSRGLSIVLTGTDLHRDLASNLEAQDALRLAEQLAVLHERGIAHLPKEVQSKARVILQSASARQVLTKTSRRLNAVIVGHLREEKSPDTIFALAHLIPCNAGITLTHIGRALDANLGKIAAETMNACPHYRWLGARSHSDTRRAIQRAHLLIHPSQMEGGANVVIEAITSGTPVLASAVDGNQGLLGDSYPGYFPWGDSASLSAQLLRLRAEQALENTFLNQLKTAIYLRKPEFHPDQEKTRVRALISDLLRP